MVTLLGTPLRADSRRSAILPILGMNDRPTRERHMHWDIRLAEANLVVADLIGAAMARRSADEDEDTSDRG
jgi:hypothetical protein